MHRWPSTIPAAVESAGTRSEVSQLRCFHYSDLYVNIDVEASEPAKLMLDFGQCCHVPQSTMAGMGQTTLKHALRQPWIGTKSDLLRGCHKS